MNVILREIHLGSDIIWSIYDDPGVAIVPVAELNKIKLNTDISALIASDAIGGYVIFESNDAWANSTLGVQITSTTVESGKTIINLANNLRSAATASEKFIISNWNWDAHQDIDSYNRSFRVGAGLEELNIDRYVTSVSYTTDIRYGYYSATIRLEKSYSQIVKFLTGSAMNYDITIFNDNGCAVWNGLIIGSRMTGLGGELFCVGYYYTNQWVYADGLYLEADADVTTPNVLIDLLKYNPYINMRHLESLDPNGTLDAAQAALGGIGPFDYIETPTLLSDAVSSILKFGNHPINSSELFLQVWDARIPILFTANRTPPLEFVRWIIDKNNIDNEYENVSIDASLDDIVTARSTTYVGADGETSYTLGSYRLPEYTWFGPRMNAISSGSLGSGTAQSVMTDATDDVIWLSKPGSVSVTGTVHSGFGPLREDCSLMRAGDTIFIMLDRPNLYPSHNLTNAGMLVRIGQTSYDSATRVNTLTLYSPGDSIEQQITVLRL